MLTSICGPITPSAINGFTTVDTPSLFSSRFPRLPTRLLFKRTPFSSEMFIKAASVLALVAPLACATIVIQQPSNIRSNTVVTINWSSTDQGNDPPTFSLELVNQIFHNSYAIGNTIPTSQGSITLTLPTVPEGDGYSLQAVNVTNINDVYSQTSQFNVGAPLSSSSSSTSGTASGSTVTVSTIPPVSTSRFGTTVGASATTVAGGSSASVSSSQTSSGSGSAPTGFNAALSQYSTSFPTLALSAIAGVALLIL
ncbi:hypothetical protein AX15_000474 [Amanita polypyramis BW_CC]|nr:hypothetical protein AX15_000474 [Amanita polypyramis BW_CC]